ncbi:hypothetical protein [Bradyrhizobium sp. 23]|uniref:hypothetical protein n=1 Tax=Bradyrhizobium sp. 23 TaxID=2782667 RepID=UPI001FF914FF|nr:hypothetical protein [Bradyrhizobium sp. 23]
MADCDLDVGKNTFAQPAITGLVPHRLSGVAIDEKPGDRMLPGRAARIQCKDAPSRREQIVGETERSEGFIVTQVMQQAEHNDEIKAFALLLPR